MLFKNQSQNFFEDHVKVYHAWEATREPAVNLLIAVSGQNQCVLYKAEGPECTDVDDYDMVGSGQYICQYLMCDMYKQNIDHDSLLTIAVHALCETKANDLYCGENSEFLILRQSGVFGPVGYQHIANIEKFSLRFQISLHEILMGAERPEHRRPRDTKPDK